MLNFRNPILSLAILLGCVFVYFAISEDKTQGVIHSDGRGYYAYLPAIFIYGDNTYNSSLKAERKESGNELNPLYLHKDMDGDTYNKFFPGVAVLQSPFFAIACFTSWINGQPIDGYSGIFQFLIYLASFFYSLIGLIYFFKSYQLLFPQDKKVNLIITASIYLGTPLLIYLVEFTSLGHLYSFSLFGIFSFLVLKLKEEQSTARVLSLSIILGLIFLVRPTNLVVVLTIPFLLGTKEDFQNFFIQLIANRGRNFIVGILGFSFIAFILFFVWKWDTGNWIAWSYNGEGFDFLHPKLFASLFSFRIGLFVHTPILLLSLFGLFYWFKKNSFASISWVVYFLINAWVISSWWCWDYESTFGNRPYTEHLIFLILPLTYFIKRHFRLSLLLIPFLILINFLRMNQYTSEEFKIQRFTAKSYLPSLQFWNSKNADRWQFTRSCKPFGQSIKRDVLIKKSEIIELNENMEYALTSSQELIKNRSNERLYIRAELDKKINNAPLKDVFLVIDAVSYDGKKRSYKAIELFNDRYEGIESWAHLIFEEQFYDSFHELDKVTVYIWNPGKKKLALKNVEIILETYKSN